MEEQIASAVDIAFNYPADQNLNQQALEFINRLRSDPSAWRPCLSLFAQMPKRSEVVRIFSLEIVNTTISGGQVDQQELVEIKQQSLKYLHETYGQPSTSADSSSIENKLAQTVTQLFSVLYQSVWVTFFDDLLQLARNTQVPVASSTVFYLKVINAVSDEIGDQSLFRSKEDEERSTTLKDLIRQRDLNKIATSWRYVLTEWGTANDQIVVLCLRAVGKWVSWVDISAVVNQQLLPLLFQQLERAQKVNVFGDAEAARSAAVDVFTEIVSKGMPATDKIEMISYLNLETVVSQLISCEPLSQRRYTSMYDADLAETVAKLVNATVIDIVKVLDTEKSNVQVWQKAERSLLAFLPHLLRFFEDEYDEVCSTVLNAMNDIVAWLRRSKAAIAVPQRVAMLLPILKAIFSKMRYDETSSWGDNDDQTDEAEFQDLRKRLGTLQQSIAGIDEQLYTDAVVALVNDTFATMRSQSGHVDWRDLDIALYEMFLFGDLAVKAGGLYNKNKPNSPAADKLVQMMLQMVDSNTGSFSHPAIELQYMEICVRYSSFFEKHVQHIQPVLESFLGFIHHQSTRVKIRSWYLFHRFVRQLRSHLGNVAQSVVQSIQDLLVIQPEEPSEEDEDDSDLESVPDSIFSSQLYLFEAVGCICGASSVPVNAQLQFLQSVMQPIFADIEGNLQQAGSSNNEQNTLQIHHDIVALGTIARGYSDWIPGGNAARSAPPVEVRPVFAKVAEITLLALRSLRASFAIRDAARTAFSRLVGLAGQRIMLDLTKWVELLLSESSTREEMGHFLRLLDQVIFAFKMEVYDLLDKLLTNLLQRVFSGMSNPATGTDDEIQLAGLKRAYLEFLMVIFSNDLGAIIVSSTNQPFFETIINSIELFAKDASDYRTGKSAFMVLTKMCSVWGGPDVVPSSGQVNGDAPKSQPALPGFDQFMMTRLSPLCWALPTNPSFDAKDAQGTQVLSEAASLQKTIYSKVGEEYLSWLRHNELRNMGMNDSMINDYLSKLASSEMRMFKVFFPRFIQQAGKA